MADCKSVTSPMSTGIFDGTVLGAKDATQYRSITGALEYLTLKRPDNAYSINKVYQFLHAPIVLH